MRNHELSKAEATATADQIWAICQSKCSWFEQFVRANAGDLNNLSEQMQVIWAICQSKCRWFEQFVRANAGDLRNLSEKMQYVTFQVPSPTLGILAPVFKDAEKSAILKVNTKSVTI